MKKHYDINGVQIGLRKNNVVTIHNKTLGLWMDSTPRSRVEKGCIGLVMGWGCIEVATCEAAVCEEWGLSYHETDIEVIGTL